MADPVLAEEVDVWLWEPGSCEVGPSGLEMVCPVANRSAEAMAQVRYEIALREDGRTVPWARAEGVLEIPGGIEPDETVEIAFPLPEPPGRAQGRAAEWELVGLLPLDLQGRALEPLPAASLPYRTEGPGTAPGEEAEVSRGEVEVARRPPSRPTSPEEAGEIVADALAAALVSASSGEATDGAAQEGPPMTEAELRDLRLAISGCWIVDAGSEAASVVVTIAFDLDRSGRVAGDVRLVSASDASPEAIDLAFQSARRAVLRCQSEGYPLPPGKFDAWRRMELTFDTRRMAVR